MLSVLMFIVCDIRFFGLWTDYVICSSASLRYCLLYVVVFLCIDLQCLCNHLHWYHKTNVHAAVESFLVVSGICFPFGQ